MEDDQGLIEDDLGLMEDGLGLMEDNLLKLLITLGSFCTDPLLVTKIKTFLTFSFQIEKPTSAMIKSSSVREPPLDS